MLVVDTYSRMLAEIRRDGITVAPSLTQKDISDVNEHLSKCTVYNAHVKAKSTESCLQTEAIVQNRWPMFCADMADVVLAPHLFELMLGYYEFAKDYFGGEQPYLYSMNAFWTQPASGPQYQDTHGWHRDGDDRKQMVVFVFGNDVPTPADGGHLYQKGTHTSMDDAALGRDFRSPPPDIVRGVFGGAGTVFVSDTKGLHMGLRPAHKPRMLAWGRWGVSNPPQSYVWDKLSPVDKELLGDRYPRNEALRKAIHLIVH
jgi:hypothetical protein